MNTESLTPAVAVEAALDHQTIQVPVFIRETLTFAELRPNQLSTFSLQGFTFKALSDAEAVGIVLMDELPAFSCAELGLDCERLLHDSMTRLMPVTLEDGTEAEVPWSLTDPALLAYTPAYLVVFKDLQPGQLSTDDENGDRVTVSARSYIEAVGLVLLRNPQLCYDDVLDHMEV